MEDPIEGTNNIVDSSISIVRLPLAERISDSDSCCCEGQEGAEREHDF